VFSELEQKFEGVGIEKFFLVDQIVYYESKLVSVKGKL